MSIFVSKQEVGHDALAQKQLLNVLAQGVGVVAKVDITSAEILALNATPIELIPAQGADQAIIVDEIIAFNKYGTATYALDGAVNAKYTDGSGDAVVSALAEAWGEATADAVAKAVAVGVAPVANAPVVLFAESADPTTGDGTFSIYVSYRVIDISQA